MEKAPLSEFAVYFGQYHLGKKGFEPGTFPEAAELAEASDYILTRFDGLNIQILCVIDVGAHPDRQFELPPENLFKIARACRAYTGGTGSSKGAVFIYLVEIGSSIAKERQERLRQYKKSGFYTRMYVMAFAIEEGSRTVWTNAPVLGAYQRRFFRSLLDNPRLTPNELAPQEIAVREPGFPFATMLVMGLLAGVFYLEFSFGLEPRGILLSPSPRTLASFGGLMKGTVENGEWYRFFLAPLLHANVLHLIFNGLALYLGGRIYEWLVGRTWLIATLILSALGGAVGSLFWVEDNVVAVGASGAILGLLAAGFICTFRFSTGSERSRLQMIFMSMLIPALIPHYAVVKFANIDFGAHMGGAITGALIGSFLLRTWPASMPLPRFRGLAIGIVAIGIAALSGSLITAQEIHQQQRLARDLIPEERYPKTDAEWAEQIDTLAGQYPMDPRIRFAKALQLMKINDLPAAERELRAGLSQKTVLRSAVDPELESTFQGMLALVLYAQGNPEAHDVAKAVCNKVPGEILGDLTQKGLCP